MKVAIGFLLLVLVSSITVFAVSSIASATLADWSEVTRFTGSGTEQYTTDYFACDHVDWRIRWECIPEFDHPELAEFSIFTYSQTDDVSYIDSINKTIVNVNKTLLQTTMGDIVIEFHDDMPITTVNFKNLTQQGVYDDTVFHRVIDGFMIQGGDPTGTGYGDPSIPTIPDEFTDHNRNDRGTIAMANAGPNTGSSQFFINLVNNNHLDLHHPVFGEVIEGMDVVDAIGKVETDENDRPLQNVTITNAKLLDASGISYIHNNSGTFYMRINVTNAQGYTIIVEQDLDSIPEFPSFLILPLVLMATLPAVIVYRRKHIE